MEAEWSLGVALIQMEPHAIARIVGMGGSMHGSSQRVGIFEDPETALEVQSHTIKVRVLSSVNRFC